MSASRPSAVYLDYAGAAPPPASLLESVYTHLSQAPAQTNPHTWIGEGATNPITEARRLVLLHLHADPSQYDVIFTSGATAAIKLVGEAFPMSRGSALCYAKNVHTSVLGLRHYFNNAVCMPPTPCLSSWGQAGTDTTTSDEYSLAAFPAECNFSGHKIDLPFSARLVHAMRDDSVLQVGTVVGGEGGSDGSGGSSRWLWLLDTAKAAATSNIDLSEIPPLMRPHFMCLSFYKIFGYPTGLGALVVRRDVAPLLRKGYACPCHYTIFPSPYPLTNTPSSISYWGGGSIDAAAANSSFSVPRSLGALGSTTSPHEIFEDGTVNFLGISALKFGFDYLQSLGGMRAIQEHTFRLAHRLVGGLRGLQHSHPRLGAAPLAGEHWGGEMCVVYGWDPEGRAVSSRSQGSIVAFNLIDAAGCFIPFSEVWKACMERGITLRMGCFCNVGGCQEFLGISADEVTLNYETGRRCGGADGTGDIINDRPTGALRASFGGCSTEEDCDALISFLLERYINTPVFDSVSGSEDNQAGCIDPGYGLNIDTSPVMPPDTPVSVYLSRIYVYPLKSCAGIRVSRWPLAAGGLYLDREWALVSEATGRVLTQKTHPKLAQCSPSLYLPGMERGRMGIDRCSDADDGHVFFRAPGMDEALVIYIGHTEELNDENSLDETGGVESDSSPLPSVLVCNRPRPVSQLTRAVAATAAPMTECVTVDGDAWFSKFLGVAVRVVRCQAQAEVAPVETKSPPDSEPIVNFSNEAQFLIISEWSLGKLATLMKNKIGRRIKATEAKGMSSNDSELRSAEGSCALAEGKEEDIEAALQISRFRPNLLIGYRVEADDVSSTLKYSDLAREDAWRRLVMKADRCLQPGDVEGIPFDVTGPCSRCQMVNVNQSTGVIDGRYLQTLAEYRKQGSRINFGHFLRIDHEQAQTIAKSGEKVGHSHARDSELATSAILHENMICTAVL